MIAGLILAAGESSRMRSPKALLRIGEVTFAEHIASTMRKCRVDPVLLVAGAHIDEIRARFGDTDKFKLLYNSRYTHGQLSSLKEGLRHLPAGVQAVLVWPVDQPLVQPDTITRLIEDFNREGKPVAIPASRGKHGHPVLYGLPAIQAILNLKKDQTAKEIRSIYKEETLFVEVDDPGILIDIDTPEEYQEHIR